jgi:hypothetical protein
MADQIKEISNGTYGIGALTNGVPIASTDADTQYVVKDIYVQNNTLPNVGATLDFVVNGVNVADIDASVSGSEIIDVSSTAVAQVPVASFELVVFENWMTTNTGNPRLNTLTQRLINNTTSLSSLSQSDAMATLPSSSSQIVSWAFVGADFYYWTYSGSNPALYRRSGGINGVQTTIASISTNMPVVFDGVDKFHWVTTTAVFTHNATTNTNSSVALITTGVSWPASLSSNVRTSYANGLVFWEFDSISGAWAINPTTGRMGLINESQHFTANDSTVEVFHTGGTYYIVNTGNGAGGSTAALKVSTIPDTSVGPLTTVNTTSTATMVYNQNTYTPEVDVEQHWPKMMPTGEFVFLSGETSGSVYVYKRFNVVTQTFATPFTINVSTITPNAGAAYNAAPFRTLSVSSDSANKLNTTFYPQTATLRVTGVETTL